MPSVFLFAGPSLGTPPSGTAFETLGPVKRGDVALLNRDHPPGTIIVADGVFQTYPAVGHRELLDAIRAGWRIWGVSSMGAIRAYEMRAFGMLGYGQVYEEFFRHYDYTDDEVALLHEENPPYRPFSEPLINIRLFLRRLVAEHTISCVHADEIVLRLQRLYFGDRTRAEFANLLTSIAKFPEARVASLLRDYESSMAKTRDLTDLLASRSWEA